MPSIMQSQLGIAKMKKNASFFSKNAAGTCDDLRAGTTKNHALHIYAYSHVTPSIRQNVASAIKI